MLISFAVILTPHKQLKDMALNTRGDAAFYRISPVFQVHSSAASYREDSVKCNKEVVMQSA